MNGATGSPVSLSDSFIADEIGIETFNWGKYRLRSLYEPILERRGGLLHRVAVEGTVVPYLNGKPIAEPDFLSGHAPLAGRDLERIQQLLQIRNHRNVGPAGLELFLGLHPWNLTAPCISSGSIGALADQMHDSGLDPRLVIWVFYPSESCDWNGLIDELRSHGFGMAVGEFGAGDWREEQLDVICPDIVRMDSAWFSQLCGHDATARLFGAVVARLRDRRAKVLVKDIDSLAKFSIAYMAGVDLFQGPFLAGSALVGTEFDETPVGIAEKLGQVGATVPLSR